MRFTDFASSLIGLWLLLASPLQALELEDQKLYPGTSATVVKVISTGDLAVFEPFILQFQAENPTIGIDYHVTSSAELHSAIQDGGVFDVAVSSAMDLQFQLANDGAAQAYASAVTEALPVWARWSRCWSRWMSSGIPKARSRCLCWIIQW